jgi:hypothetical protein
LWLDFSLCCANWFLYVPATFNAGTIVPNGQLWAGNPAVYIRDVSEDEIAGFTKVHICSLDVAVQAVIVTVWWLSVLFLLLPVDPAH